MTSHPELNMNEIICNFYLIAQVYNASTPLYHNGGTPFTRAFVFHAWSGTSTAQRVSITPEGLILLSRSVLAQGSGGQH